MMQEPEEPNELEMGILGEALRGNTLWKSVLRAQISHLKVISREYTVVGSYTDFRIDGALEKAIVTADTPGYPPVVSVRHPSLPHGGAFIVWANDGVITTLEAIADGDGVWPPDASITSFSFERLDDQSTQEGG